MAIMKRSSLLKASMIMALMGASAASPALRGRNLGWSVDVPGTSISVDSHGVHSDSVNVDSHGVHGDSVNVDSHGVQEDGISIDSHGVHFSHTHCNDDQEDMPEAQAVKDDENCQQVLPSFYDNTTQGKFDDLSDSERVELMDNFCKSTCSNKYTSYLKAAGMEGRDCARQRLVTERRSHHHDDESEDNSHEDDSGSRRRRGHRNDNNDDEEDEGNDIVDGINNVLDGDWTGSRGYHPSNSYPGLMLGCLKDSGDKKYCALKAGNLEDESCDFFMSCCYGSYLKDGEDTEELIKKIERKCPGSKAFATKPCA